MEIVDKWILQSLYGKMAEDSKRGNRKKKKKKVKRKVAKKKVVKKKVDRKKVVRKKAARKGWETRRKNERKKVIEERKAKKQFKKLIAEKWDEIKIRIIERENQKIEIAKEKIRKIKRDESVSGEEFKGTKSFLFKKGFEKELITSVNVVAYVKERFETFIKEPPQNLEMDFNAAPLLDGTVIIQTKFYGWDREDIDEYRGLMIDLANIIGGFANSFRISISHEWDVEELTVAHETDGDYVLIQREDGTWAKYKLKEKRIEMPMNVSVNTVNSFATAMNNLVPDLTETFGVGPASVIIRLVWGAEEGRKINREAIKI